MEREASVCSLYFLVSLCNVGAVESDNLKVQVSRGAAPFSNRCKLANKHIFIAFCRIEFKIPQSGKLKFTCEVVLVQAQLCDAGR